MQSQQFESSLLALQSELNNRVNAIKADFSNQRSADFSEQATEQENEEVLVQLLNDAEHELRQVNVALVKLKTGNFGTCEHCGEEISLQRLEAIPFTNACINCA